MIEYLNICDQVPRDLQRQIAHWEREGAGSINVILRPSGDIVVLSHASEGETKRILQWAGSGLIDEVMH